METFAWPDLVCLLWLTMRTKGWKLPDLLLQLFGTSHTTLFNEESESKREKMILKLSRMKATRSVAAYI